MYKMRVHLERIRLRSDYSSIPPLKITFPGKMNYQVRALSCLRQSLKPYGFLTKIYIVTGSLNLMIFPDFK